MIKVKNMDKFLIESSSSIFQAMNLINKSGKGICFVTNLGKLAGVVTDGDIRRTILKNKNLEEKISNVMRKEFIFLKLGAHVNEIQSKLKKVEYIPIVNKKYEVVDVASRQRFHQIPLIEPVLNGKELEFITDCINTGWVSSLGKYITLFEKKFAKYTCSKNTCVVSNGTVALHLALVALGIKSGDEVIVPNLTFVAPVNAVIYCGATPVLVDVDKETMTLNTKNIQRAITKKTTAIIPVHLYGYPAPMEEIMKIAKLNDLIVIEDCAEALGSIYKGKHVGLLGDAGTFSFFGNKTITTGEGGMIIFKDKSVLDYAKILRDHGMSKDKKYWHNYIGFNYRMTNMQAAIGVAQMEVLPKFVKAKRRIAKEYNFCLANVDGVKLPKESQNIIHSYWLYTIILSKNLSPYRDKIIKLMLEDGIEAREIFIPASDMPPYQKYIRKNINYDVSEYLSKSCISLPSGVNLKKKDIKRISTSFKNALKKVNEWN